ncbi:hypothetical protein [Bradyrhizobium sp. 2TAF24]|uniref:hypothetical protein n=1 Tax=Bradyrhizobium sp. 2TAF24 TaxID=3233011 RepID=UPI003F906D2B
MTLGLIAVVLALLATSVIALADLIRISPLLRRGLGGYFLTRTQGASGDRHGGRRDDGGERR